MVLAELTRTIAGLPLSLRGRINKIIMKKETNEIALTQKQLPHIQSGVKALVIADNKDLTIATQLLSELNQRLDAVVADREKITKPLNTSLKEVRAKYKPYESALEHAIAEVRNKMSVYATETEAKKQAIADRVKSGSGNLKIETALGKIEAIAVPSVTETENGSVKFRPLPTLKVTALDKIPREYFDLNESRLLTALKQGVVVEGAEIVIIQNVVNSRN